jgi:deoxycytidylate deaminase
MRSPSGCHDATHLRMSSIWHKMHNDELPNKLHDEQNAIVQPYLLGDSAYPIRIGLLKYFTTRGTNTAQ